MCFVFYKYISCCFHRCCWKWWYKMLFACAMLVVVVKGISGWCYLWCNKYTLSAETGGVHFVPCKHQKIKHMTLTFYSLQPRTQGEKYKCLFIWNAIRQMEHHICIIVHITDSECLYKDFFFQETFSWLSLPNSSVV